MERSAVFIVPRIVRFGGTPNRSPEYGSVTCTAFGSPSRLSSSISVISSPSTFAMFARLISSMIIRYSLSGFFSAVRQARLKTPSTTA